MMYYVSMRGMLLSTRMMMIDDDDDDDDDDQRCRNRILSQWKAG